MTRQVTDQLYIELDYYYPEEYYVYTAEAVVSLSAEFTTTCDASIVVPAVEAEAQLTVETSLTVDVTKIIDYASTLSVTVDSQTQASAIYSGTVNEISLFSPNFVVNVVVDPGSDLAVEFALSALADNLPKQANVTLETIVTLNIQAAKIKEFNSTMAAEFTHTESSVKYVSYIPTSPHPFYARGEAYIVSSPAKFGSGSLYLPTTGAYGYTADSADWDIEAYGGAFTIDMWLYPTQYPADEAVILGQSSINGTNLTSRYGWAVSITDIGRIRLNYNNTSIQATQALTLNTWNHVRICREDSAAPATQASTYIWINGIRRFNGLTSRPWSPLSTRPLYIGGHPETVGGHTYLGYIDGVHLIPGTQLSGNVDTITVPTVETNTALADTKLLLNFNGTWIDQSQGALETATANLTSTATITVQSTTLQQSSAGLTSTASISCVLSKISRTTSAVSSNFTTSATVRRLRPLASALSSQFSLTAVGRDLDLASIAISGQFNLSASLTNVSKRASANFNSSASLSATVNEIVGYIPGNLRSLLHFENNLFDSAASVTVSGTVPSYEDDGTNTYFGSFNFDLVAKDPSNIVITRTTGDYNTDIGTQDFSYDVRLIAADINLNSDENGTIIRFSDDTNQYHLIYDTTPLQTDPFGGPSTPAKFRLRFKNVTTDTTLMFVEVDQTNYGFFPYTTYYPYWKHIKLIRVDNVLYMYYNGTQVDSCAFAVDLTPTVVIAPTINILGTPTVFQGFLDESALRIGSNYNLDNFTPPTNPYIPGLIVFGYSSLESTATLTGDFLKVKLFSASVSSQSSVTANIDRIRSADTSAFITSTLTANATKVVRAVSQNSSTISLSASLDRSRETSVSLSSAFALNVAVKRFRSTTLAAQSNFTITNQLDRIRYNSSNLNSNFAVSATALRIKQLDTEFDSIGSVLAAVAYIGNPLVSIETFANMTADAHVITGSIVNMTVSTQLVSGILKTTDYSADLSAEFSSSTLADKIKKVTADLSSEFTANTVPMKLNGGASNISAISTAVINPLRIRDLETSLNTTTTVDVPQIDVIVDFNCDMSSEFIPLFIAGVVVRFTADLEAFDFVLSAGRVIHIDPDRQLIVPSENRYKLVTMEIRNIVVPSETRMEIV